MNDSIFLVMNNDIKIMNFKYKFKLLTSKTISIFLVYIKLAILWNPELMESLVRLNNLFKIESLKRIFINSKFL